MLTKTILFLFLLSVIAARPNLFIGTGGVGYGCGSNSPAVQRPFSYVRLGPDTTPIPKKLYFQPHHFGGYSQMDHAVRAFSHMHLVGAGVADLGVLGILPVKKRKLKIPIDQQIIFYKSSQYAQPGYYNVTLENDIEIQLTSTQRCGVHRYKFKQNSTNQIYILSSHLIQKKAERKSTTKRCGEKCLQGDIFIQGSFGRRFGGYHIYYYLIWENKNSTTNDTVYMFDDKNISQNATSVTGNYSGVIIETSSKQTQMFVGLSYVSLKNAKENLMQQVNGRNFDQIRIESKNVWDKEFLRFQITAISQQYQTKIDTALYRTFLSPTLFNDFNGEYLSFSLNGSAMVKPDDMKGVYTDMSLWDVHRSQFPWLLFQDPDRFNDIAKSIIIINRQGGYMPKWPFANGPTGCMIGSHANTVLADWFLKQAHKDPSIDKQELLGFMLRNANERTRFDSRSDPKIYLQQGYISSESGHSSCSETLELSYNDFSISQVAKSMQKNDIQNNFRNRSMFYKNVWNPKTKFFQPRFKNGSFIQISEFERVNIFSTHYTQGDAWHYRFYAPHDPQGLIELFEGKQKFVSQLNVFFQKSFYWNTKWLPNPYYWAGNQHNLLSVWQFNFANRSDLTQKYSRKILETSYGLDGAGLPGNDDYGTMSAWLIFASLGFYPVPSQSFYILGSPVIHSARIYRKRSEGKLQAFNINVKNNSASNNYVELVQLNGKKAYNFIQFEQMQIQNTVLEFVMKK